MNWKLYGLYRNKLGNLAGLESLRSRFEISIQIVSISFSREPAEIRELLKIVRGKIIRGMYEMFHSKDYRRLSRTAISLKIGP